MAVLHGLQKAYPQWVRVITLTRNFGQAGAVQAGIEHARRAEALIPGARLELVPDCGHICLLDQPERVSSLLSEFMRGN